jgi:hypothetical protein
VAGAVGFNYDSSFRVTPVTVNGANAITLGYDNDDLLTTAGSLTLARGCPLTHHGSSAAMTRPGMAYLLNP